MQKIISQAILIGLLLGSLLSTVVMASNPGDKNVIIFVSFSMPNESLKGWITEAERIHAPLVIRGLVNNSFKETLACMKELVGDNKGGMQLDPVLFKKFQIKQVPAVVVRKENEYDVIYGDAHLGYALETVIKRNDNLSVNAQQALNMLRGQINA